MKVIVGLGNVGRKYEKTRHNAGFMGVEALADRLKCRFAPGKSSFVVASGNYQGETLRLVKPLTYMNRSGIAVRVALQAYNAKPEDLLIIYDDIHLPLGEIRLRGKGSAGGHNGIRSIQHELQTQEFDRLRIGIGSPDDEILTDYVLQPFRREELDPLDEVLDWTTQAIISYLEEGLEKTMSLFNRRIFDDT